jgi:O-antigen/teichoic acid export membrane protein
MLVRYQLIIANLAAAFAGMIAGIIVARALGPTARGELATVVPIAVLVSSISLFGVSDFIVWYSARNKGYPNWQDMRRTRVLGLAIGITLFLLFTLHAAITSTDVRILVVIAVCLLPALQQSLIKQAYLQGTSQFSKLAAFRFLPQALTLSVLLALYWTDLISLYAVAITQLLFGSLAIFVGTRKAPQSQASELDASQCFSIGRRAWLAGLPALILQRIDLVVVTILVADKTDIGYYAIALTLSALPQMVAQSLGTTIRTKSVLNSGISKLSIMYNDAAIVITFTYVLIFATPYIIPILMGESYRPSIPAGIILLLAAIPLGLSTLLAEEMLGQNQFPLVRKVWTSGAAATGVALLIAIPTLGFIGAAIACLIGYSLTLVLMLRLRGQLRNAQSAL